MSSEPIHEAKSDVIDLIIEVLRDHDILLTELVGKLSKILDRLPVAKIDEDARPSKDVIQRLLEIYENKRQPL